jgi:hypothetical protein
MGLDCHIRCVNAYPVPCAASGVFKFAAVTLTGACADLLDRLAVYGNRCK